MFKTMINYSGTEANLLCELEEITNPYIFGLHLGIDSKVVDRIDRDHRNDVERQRSEVVKYWYRNTKVLERTWGRVADAIKKLGGHRNLEMKLRQLAIPTTGKVANNGMMMQSQIRSTRKNAYQYVFVFLVCVE